MAGRVAAAIAVIACGVVAALLPTPLQMQPQQPSATAVAAQLLSACFWVHAVYYLTAVIPLCATWLLKSLSASKLKPAAATVGLALLHDLLQQTTALLALSFVQSAAQNLASEQRLPAPLPACTWDITLPSLVPYTVTVCLLVAGLGAAVLLYCALYWRGGGALQTEMRRTRVCLALNSIWAPMDLLMFWGVAALAHAANMGLRHWVITNHPEAPPLLGSHLPA